MTVLMLCMRAAVKQIQLYVYRCFWTKRYVLLTGNGLAWWLKALVLKLFSI